MAREGERDTLPLRIAAHDIKSPLAALKGYSEIARESTGTDQPISRLLNRMDALTTSTLEMVNTLFDHAIHPQDESSVCIDSGKRPINPAAANATDPGTRSTWR